MASLDELRAAMRSATGEAVPPPGLLDDVRRTVDRRRKVRAVVAAAVVVAAVAALALFVPRGGEDGAPAPGPRLLTGQTVPAPARQEGMDLVTALRFDRLGAWAGVEFTATGENTMIVTRCTPKDLVIFSRRSAGGCGSSLYLATTPGQKVSQEFLALPDGAVALDKDAFANIDAYLAARPPAPGNWEILAYSGLCDTPTCQEQRNGPPPPALDTAGLEVLRTADGVADAETVTVRTDGRATRLKLVCLDGAGWAVVWRGGKPGDPIDCERTESEGSVWDEPAAASLKLTVYPASVTNPTLVGNPHPSAADLAKLARTEDAAGTWKLTVYAAP